jgi:hypothetical protein
MTDRRFGGFRKGVLVLVLVAGTSCGPIPSITPFSEQTDRMVTGINGGYTASQLSLAAVNEELAKKLAEAWAPTAAALNGIVAYSQALISVATAGAEGSKAAGNVADAANGLLASFNVAAIPANLVAGFKALNGQIAVIRAKRSLHEAVGATDPVVAELATIVSAQLKALSTLHDLTVQNALLNNRANHSPMVDYVEAERRAEARILQILQRILDYQERGQSDELLQAITKLDPSARRDNIEARETHWLDIVKRHQAHLAAYDDRYAEYERRAGELNASRRAGAATLTKAQGAVTAWAGAHAKLKAALEKKIPPDFSAFFAAVRDVATAFSSAAQTE